MNCTWWLRELREVLIPAAQGEYKKAAEEEYCWTLAAFQRVMEEYERSTHAD